MNSRFVSSPLDSLGLVAIARRSFISLFATAAVAGSLAGAQIKLATAHLPVAGAPVAVSSGKSTPGTRFLHTGSGAAADARRQAAIRAAEIPGVPHVATARPVSAARMTAIAPQAIPNAPAIGSVSPASKNFGSVAAATGSATQTFTFTFSAGGTIAAPAVVTQGVANQDYTDLGTGSCTTNGTAHTYAAKDTCTVVVQFKPKATGTRTGAVELLNTAGTSVLGSAFLTGTDSAPQLTFAPPTIPLVPVYSTGAHSTYQTATDPVGDVFVAYSNGSITEIVATNGTVSASSTTKAVGSGFGVPTGVAVDAFGDVWVYDATVGNIYEVQAVGGSVSSTSPIVTFTTGYTTGYIAYLAFDPNGNLYIIDGYDPNLDYGSMDMLAATNGSIPSTATLANIGYFDAPLGLGFDTVGDALVEDGDDQVVYFLPIDGSVVDTTSYNDGYSVGPTFPDYPSSELYGLAVEPSGSLLLTDYQAGALYEVSYTAGAYAASYRTVSTGYTSPRFVSVDASGNIYVSNSAAHALEKIALSTPTPLIFPNTAVGSSSATQTVTVENIGTTDLTLPAPSSGQNPSLSPYFTLGNTSTCPQVSSVAPAAKLASGANCTEVLSYSPTIAGSVTGNLIFTDNSLNVTGATQTIVETGSSVSTLTLSVIGQNVARGAGPITLEFIVGYGGNTAPTGTPTLTVNSSTTNVGTIACTAKVGHNNCTATYNSSTLAKGAYTITATQPADSTYTTATSATGTLTVY